MSAAAAAAVGMSVRGDGREGGGDGPQDRLGRLAAEAWAFAHVGEGGGMTTTEEEEGRQLGQRMRRQGRVGRRW